MRFCQNDSCYTLLGSNCFFWLIFIDILSICQTSFTVLDHEESVIVLSDTAVCGKVSKSADKPPVSYHFLGLGDTLNYSFWVYKLTLANIDSVILDLHRLGCNKKGQKKYSVVKKMKSEALENPPESLSDLKYHHLFGAGTFGRVWCVTKVGGKTAYALKIQSKRELLDQRQASSAVRERGVMAKLDHPFVCKLVAR